MKRRIWLAVVFLLVASLACSLGDQAAEVVEDVADDVADAVVDAAGDAAEDAVEDAISGGDMPQTDPNWLDGLDSYRATTTWSWAEVDGESGEMTMMIEETRNPQAQRYSMTSEGQTFEWVQIGDTMWMNFGTGWAQTQQSPEEIASTFGDTMFWDVDDLAFDEYNYNYEGTATIDGMNTRYYTFQMTASQAAVLFGSEVTDFQGEVWIVNESNLPEFAAKYIMHWEGTTFFGTGEGEMDIIYEVYDVNDPFTIEPPEGAGESPLPDDVPVYPNTTDFFAMEGMVSFNSSDDVATVGDFYSQQLPGEGWTLSSDQSFGGMVMQTWTKSGRELSLIVSEEDGGSAVVLSLTE
jgi:hypothetical protein